MKKLKAADDNNIQNGRDFKPDFSKVTRNLSANIMPKRSSQKAALLTLVLLGNVAWIPSSYGMNEDELRNYAAIVQARHVAFEATRRTNGNGLTIYGRHWGDRLREFNESLTHFIELSKEKGRLLDVCIAENNQYVNKVNECLNDKISLSNHCTAVTNNLQQDVTAAQNAQNLCHTNLNALTESYNAIVGESNVCKNSLQQQAEQFETYKTDLRQDFIERDKSFEAQQRELEEYKNLYYQAQSDLNWSKDRAKLGGYSAAAGAVTSLLPEMIKDGVSLTRYAEHANKVGSAITLLEGGVIAYNAASYSPSLTGMFLPALTGMAVRSGLNYWGVVPEKSVTAGNTVAILTSFAQRLIFEPETSFYDVLDHGIAVAANWGGSVLALHLYDSGKYLFHGCKGENNDDNDSPDNNPPKPKVLENFTNTPCDDSDDGNPPTATAQEKENNATKTKENEVNPTLHQALAPLLPMLLDLSELKLESKPYESIQKHMEEIMNLSACLNASIAITPRPEDGLTPQLDKFTSGLNTLNESMGMALDSDKEEANSQALELINRLKFEINMLFKEFEG